MTKRTKQDAELSSAGLFEDLAQPSAEQVQQAQAEKAIKQGQGAPRLLQPNRSLRIPRDGGQCSSVIADSIPR